MPEKTLRAESASPLYAQLMDRIRQDILQGIYPVGNRIPAEYELEERYGVSRVTVRRALQELTGAGMLERKQGKGTFVAQPKRDVGERRLQSFHDACRAAGRVPSVLKVRTREIPASPEDREKLNLEPDAQVLEIRRVLAADGEAVMLQVNRFSAAYTWLESVDLRGSLYAALQEYGIRAEKSTYDISLRKADGEEAELLRVEPGRMVLEADQIVYDQKGRPLHTSRQLILGEKYTLRI